MNEAIVLINFFEKYHDLPRKEGENMMKKILLVILTCMLIFMLTAVSAEEMEDETAELSVLEIAMMRPESEEPTHLTVGNTTKVKGSFFTTFFGNNTSDIDVRTMLHGYSPVVWDNQLQFLKAKH